MFEDAELIDIVVQMKTRQVEFDPGLSDAEIKAIEQDCKFQFPADLRAFLQLGMPIRWIRHDGTRIEDRFPNWRDDPIGIMDDARKWAADTFYFDIEHNKFWMEAWGTRPEDLSEAIALVGRYLQTVPLLIPIYAHRFLPAQPNLPGNPVFSVWQAVDTIYYGYNLQDYLQNEFIRDETKRGKPSAYRHIPFWSEIVS